MHFDNELTCIGLRMENFDAFRSIDEASHACKRSIAEVVTVLITVLPSACGETIDQNSRYR